MPRNRPGHHRHHIVAALLVEIFSIYCACQIETLLQASTNMDQILSKLLRLPLVVICRLDLIEAKSLLIDHGVEVNGSHVTRIENQPLHKRHVLFRIRASSMKFLAGQPKFTQ